MPGLPRRWRSPTIRPPRIYWLATGALQKCFFTRPPCRLLPASDLLQSLSVMLILIFQLASTLMNSAEVNRPPRRPAGVCLQATRRGPVLEISGLPWLANASSGFDVQAGFQRDRAPPCQRPAREPVQRGGETHEAPRHPRPISQAFTMPRH